MSGETRSSAAGGPAPAGWGTPDWLPPNVARRAARDDARERREAAAAERERELRTEERHSRAMELYCQQAALRGEEISAVAIATGRVAGRSVGDILAAAVAAADRDDVITEARLRREGHGDPELLHVEVGEPRILAPAARSSTARAIATRARRFVDVLEARRKLAAAERAAQASMNDLGLVDGVTLRPREHDPVVAVTASRRGGRPAARDDGLRFR